MSTRSTVKKPGETIPGAERWPMGPPISSVKFLRNRSLRLGTTRRARFRWGGVCVSCMCLSLPVDVRGPVKHEAGGTGYGLEQRRSWARAETTTRTWRCSVPQAAKKANAVTPSVCCSCRTHARKRGESPRVAARAPCEVCWAKLSISSSLLDRKLVDAASAHAAHLLVHQYVDVLPFLVKQPAVEPRLLVHS
jgi:hypothetical protein